MTSAAFDGSYRLELSVRYRSKQEANEYWSTLSMCHLPSCLNIKYCIICFRSVVSMGLRLYDIFRNSKPTIIRSLSETSFPANELRIKIVYFTVQSIAHAAAFIT